MIMKKVKVNVLFGIGCVLFSIVQVVTHIVETPNNLLNAVSGAAAGLILVGALMWVISPKMKQWKLSLFSKNKEEI